MQKDIKLQDQQPSSKGLKGVRPLGGTMSSIVTCTPTLASSPAMDAPMTPAPITTALLMFLAHLIL